VREPAPTRTAGVRTRREPGRRRASPGIAAAAVVALAASAPAAAASTPAPAAQAAPGDTVPRGALILEADDAMRPAYVEFFRTFRSAVVAELNGPMALYAENFDIARLDRPGYIDELFDWHCRKYRGRDLRVIVTIGGPAYAYAVRWRDACSPGTPIVFANISKQALARIGRPPGVTGLTQRTDFGEIVRVAFELLPATRRIAVVGGPTDVYAQDFLASARELYAGRAEILDLTGLPMPTLLERVSALPAGTIVAYTSLITDGAGRTFDPTDAAAMVARAASVPMFGLTTTQLGRGTVGGRLISPTLVGRDVALLAVRVFQGEAADAIPVRDAEIFEHAFDARPMQRWGLDLDALPPGSRVINRRPSLWEAYRGAVVVALVAFALQALLIGALLRARRARQRVNRELHRLSRELIVSQENERRRVARELHDDVGQQLALLSIELEQLRHGAGAAVAEGLAAAAARANAISTGVHDLARDLHPARLETLGLPAALRALAEEVRARHGLEVDVRLVDWPGEIAADAALALYRVAQEALQNAIKHAGAATVSIELRATPAALAMTVADDGRGFARDRPSPGIGLAGMAERVALVGGSLAIDTAPGEGTSVRVTLPNAAGEARAREPAASAA
jgi:signal transduction histidine kinase